MPHSILTRPIGALVLGVVFAGIAPTALADTLDRQSPSKNITVSYEDLNIEGDAGARALVNRIAAAATQVCGGQGHRPMPRVRSQFDACRSSAMQSAIVSVNHPVVSAIYENKQTPNRRLASR